jgi:acyl-CoA synthetase (AMP-forming)/AMP-acid ligase II
MSNLALNLVASAARIPDRTAAITSEQTMTYAELERASARLATLLEREGIGVGDRVGVMLPNIAAQVRSARRSKACTCAWSTRMATKSRPEVRESSKSRAPTS